MLDEKQARGLFDGWDSKVSVPRGFSTLGGVYQAPNSYVSANSKPDQEEKEVGKKSFDFFFFLLLLMTYTT